MALALRAAFGVRVCSCKRSGSARMKRRAAPE